MTDSVLHATRCRQQQEADSDDILSANGLAPVMATLYAMNLRDVNEALLSFFQAPDRFVDRMQHWWEKQSAVIQSSLTGAEDARFSAPEWNNNDMYGELKARYLYLCRSVDTLLDTLGEEESGGLSRLKFFSRQLLSALSPANYLFTNPEALARTADTRGENLRDGLARFTDDLSHSDGILNIRQVGRNAFLPGVHLASTPGSVVFRNDICELIQYTPMTEVVNQTPLLIVPPLINKYYILDLSEKNSMVRWLLEQGHVVFMLSWRNPDASLKEAGFERYVLDGVVSAVNVIEGITGCGQINAAGYCLGGTLLACTIAYYTARRMKKKIRSASYFTTLLDFSMPGEVGAYIDPTLLSVISEQNVRRGYMDGRMLNVTFNSLRENSLYWNYYTSHYLLGKPARDFDLLFWSSDSINVTAACWQDIVQEFYLHNRLIQPRGFKVGGVYIDLSRIDIPGYFVSAGDDHIALWQGTYQGARHLKGDTTFVLGGAGHVAGIINPPVGMKYGYRVNDTLPDDAGTWLSTAKEHPGSWWPHWHQWLKGMEKGEPVPAYAVGNETWPVLAEAPGDYVRATV